MPIMELKGEKYNVQKSTKKDKKLMVECNGKLVHFGQRAPQLV